MKALHRAIAIIVSGTALDVATTLYFSIAFASRFAEANPFMQPQYPAKYFTMQVFYLLICLAPPVVAYRWSKEVSGFLREWPFGRYWREATQIDESEATPLRATDQLTIVVVLMCAAGMGRALAGINNITLYIFGVGPVGFILSLIPFVPWGIAVPVIFVLTIFALFPLSFTVLRRAVLAEARHDR